MNKSPLTSIMTGALGLSALASLVLCGLTLKNTHELRALRIPMARAMQERSVAISLYNEAAEYAKKNPAIIPYLPQGIQAPAAPAKPAK